MNKELFIPILVGLALPGVRKIGTYRTRSFPLVLTLTEENNLEDTQGGREVELGNTEPQLVPLGAVVVGSESFAPVG